MIGVGMLALGVPLMIACAVRFRAFFRGETLNEDRDPGTGHGCGAGPSTRVDRCEHRSASSYKLGHFVVRVGRGFGGLWLPDQIGETVPGRAETGTPAHCVL